MSEQSGNWYCSYCGSTTPGVHIAAGEWRCPAMAADDGVLAVQQEVASLREQLAEVQRQLAALKAQGACDSCEHFRLDVDITTGADDLFCALHAQQCAVFGGRCGMWAAKAPVAPTPEG